MENLHDYILWYNTYTNTWYGIPRDQYMVFFNGGRAKAVGVLEASSVDALITEITN
jgi:hypothetical protein